MVDVSISWASAGSKEWRNASWLSSGVEVENREKKNFKTFGAET